jgi:hypothetical protein
LNRRPAQNERSTPIGGAQLPPSGMAQWPGASHCIVVNKTRSPQYFRDQGVLGQFDDVDCLKNN